MDRKPKLDAEGAAALLGFTLLFAFNQVVIAHANGGFQPVFQAALRSALAIPFVLLWIRYRGIPLRIAPGTWKAGLLMGLLFSFEFVSLFLALDLTTVARSSVIFYSMPVWLALGAHFLLPGEGLTPLRVLGLAFAFAGVAWAILGRAPSNGEASLSGDLAALCAALGWAGMAVTARASALSRVPPELQLLWQTAVSVPVLFALALFFGPLLRGPEPLHIAALIFQAAVVVTFGFVGWLTLLSRYPAAQVASFSFLTPVLGVILGWLLLGERISGEILLALALVASGIFLINRPQAGSITSAQTGR
jgi:drug/metabolite transporter (DMT)-like permease